MADDPLETNRDAGGAPHILPRSRVPEGLKTLGILCLLPLGVPGLFLLAAPAVRSPGLLIVAAVVAVPVVARTILVMNGRKARGLEASWGRASEAFGTSAGFGCLIAVPTLLAASVAFLTVCTSTGVLVNVPLHPSTGTGGDWKWPVSFGGGIVAMLLAGGTVCWWLVKKYERPAFRREVGDAGEPPPEPHRPDGGTDR